MRSSCHGWEWAIISNEWGNHFKWTRKRFVHFFSLFRLIPTIPTTTATQLSPKALRQMEPREPSSSTPWYRIFVGMVRCSSDTPRYLRWVRKTSGKQLSPCSWSTSTMAIVTRYSLGDTSCKLLFCSRCSTPWKKCSWILVLEGEDHYDKESNLTKPFFRWMVPALAIELALDHKPSHREMTSRLISVLYLKVITLVK